MTDFNMDLMTDLQTQSLQTFCLKCIASNFDRFFTLFYSSSNERFRNIYILLQKVYGVHLLKMVSEEFNLRDEYLKFLVNKYSHKLNLIYLFNCDSSAIEERLQEIGSIVKSFEMPGIKKFNCDHFLKYLSKVQVLQLANTIFSDNSMAIIAKNCPELKSLDVYQCSRVSDKGLEILCEAPPPLENLNVEHTSVTYRGVALVLKKIPSLTKLFFDNVPRAIFEATGLNETSGISNYIVLNLNNLVILNNPMRPENHLTTILNVCTVSCPYVQNLIVSEIITEEQLDLISTFENLVIVSLQCSTIVNPKLCINNFLEIRGSKLTSLSLTSFSLSVKLLASCCPNLESLGLQYPSFEDTDDICSSSTDLGFSRLRIFNLQNASLEMNESQISFIISSSPNLEELHMVYCFFSEEMKEIILQYPKKLTLLNLNNTIVSADFVEEIIRVHNDLERLELRNSGISSTEYDDLMDMVDEMEKKVNISWADYTEAIRELYHLDDSVFNTMQKRYILKL
ncbi:uncharacterized protein LOC129967108 [Argiope bruennichi]|uniref:Uncharacterized protein n=1 Tax=Argiope bruennichi TaxID=94029 RepID=A0A8T0E6G4_ARGBR|nr:uncharacterized protein LOC129967108 [Argiope bruennichi]KAF8767383.1 hypothetical protein HNY73_020356 [Argiope bruennichi]